jgi:CRISPR/Cas system-associated exonuclease Cas4 (RecB family)
MTAISTISTITSISQGYLNIWETCQRKYQYSFLEELSLPEADLQSKKNLQLGANFHLLMQQKELGLDVSTLASSDVKLQLWLESFENQPPLMIDGDRLCEHRRTLEIDIEELVHHSQNSNQAQGHFVLTAIYDLLILGYHQAQILDWKTHQVALKADKLENNWQTRLYLYLLAKTTEYKPEQLSMTYWFANTAESVIINYSQVSYDRTEKNLLQILTEIAQAQEYPKLPSGSRDCKYCEFRDRCDRGDMAPNVLFSNIEDIPEVTI